jgi:hypothetical protein
MWYCHDIVVAGSPASHYDELEEEVPFHHLLTLATEYRVLLATPALTMPFKDWTVAGYRTILVISG